MLPRLLLGGVLLLSAPLRADVVERVAAVVNDEVITWTEIYELAAPHIEEKVAAGGGDQARRDAELEVLEVMVGRRLIEQEMRRLGLDVTETDMERALADVARQNQLDRDRLQAEVERSGMAWSTYVAEFKENLREMKFNQQIIAPRITLRDDEIQDLYRRNGASFAGAPRARLQAILLPLPPSADPAATSVVVEKARAVRAEILGGRSFEDSAAEHSSAPYGMQRGTMGLFQNGDLTPVLNDAAFALPVGGLSEPLVTAQGVYLLRVSEFVPQDLPPFEKVKSALEAQLMENKIKESRDQWLAQARRRASVSIRLEPVAP